MINKNLYYDKQGRPYQIITEAETSESAASSDTLVVYQRLFDDYRVFAMPVESFNRTFNSKCTQSEKKVLNEAKTPNNSHNNSLNDNPSGSASENNSGVNPGLLAFLDAETYEEKLEVLHGLHDCIDVHMLNAIAVSLDISLPEGTCEEQYDSLIYCLSTHKRFETNRLR